MSVAEVYEDPEFTIGDRIALARRQRGWDQQQLADAVGVSRPLVSKWERGKSLPDVEEAMAICHHLQRRLVWLLNAPSIIRCKTDAPPLSSANPVLGQRELPFPDSTRPGPLGVVPSPASSS